MYLQTILRHNNMKYPGTCITILAASLVALLVLDALSIACTHSCPCNTHSIQYNIINFTYNTHCHVIGLLAIVILSNESPTYLTVAGTVA